MVKVTQKNSTATDERQALPYNLFFLFLLAYTVIEVVVFINRDNWHLQNKILVPGLLALSLIKFILVIGWFLYNTEVTGWFRKITLVSLATGGVTGLIVYLLLGL